MELCEFQKIDPSNNLVMPWLTHPALDEICKWNLSNKKVLEYGSGYSTLWWANKCQELVSIEANEQWYLQILSKLQHDIINPKGLVDYHFRPVNEGDQSKIDLYTAIPTDFLPDIVVVDGILRYECMLKALTLPRPLTLIVDNWRQDYVFICRAAEDLMKDYEGQFFVQPDHKNHEGRPWTTAIWHLK